LSAHRQKTFPAESRVQVAPFLHGLFEHLLGATTGVSQMEPVNEARQVHWNWLVLGEKQVAPFLHGLLTQTFMF